MKSPQPISPQAAPAARAADAYPWLSAYPRDVDWRMQFTPSPLPELLDRAVAKYGDRPCTNFLGKTLTYAEIGALAGKAAKGLQQLGVKKGVNVGLMLPNTPSYIIFYYAILKAGGTVVNFNPLYTIEELTFQTKDSGIECMVTLDLKMLFDKAEALLASGVLPRAIICPFGELLPAFKSLLFRLFKGRELANWRKSPQIAKIIPAGEITDNDGRFEPARIDAANDIAVLQYTGGTTGTPKGAMLTHANLSINVQQMIAWAPFLKEGEERMMGILPFFHVFAMTVVMNFGIALGAAMILMPRFELRQALKLINAAKPTIMPGVPNLYNAMMNSPDLQKYDFSSLKFCVSGGAPLPIEVKRGFEKLSGCKLVEGYGLSETSPVTHCNLPEGPVREGSIGLPLPRTVVSIRDLEDPALEMPLGENGEICVAGPQVMKGYWNKPKETADSFVGEFFRTGDSGYVDREGFTYIVDRIKDMIISSGYKVYPRRIEEAIYEHPAVQEVTVIGIPDARRGEVPKAFIKLREGEQATAEEVMAFLKPKLSKIELPAQIEFRSELPKTLIGKLSKKELRQESGKAGEKKA